MDKVKDTYALYMGLRHAPNFNEYVYVKKEEKRNGQKREVTDRRRGKKA